MEGVDTKHPENARKKIRIHRGEPSRWAGVSLKWRRESLSGGNRVGDMARFRLKWNDAQNSRGELPHLIPRERQPRRQRNQDNQQKRRRGFTQCLFHKLAVFWSTRR